MRSNDLERSARILIRVVLFFVLLTCFFTGFNRSLEAAEIVFTEEEKAYIQETGVLQVVSIDGIAPLSYFDANGRIKGIGISICDEISLLSGLSFEYRLYESTSAALADDYDVYVNAEKKYAPKNMLLSQPYLESETVLFYHKSLDVQDLTGQRYAAILGGELPVGISKEQTIYYNDRETTLDAVEAGLADFSYGNAYSVAFYTLQNGYSNIKTIPTGKEDRAYCAGVLEGNEILLSIINKSIEALDQNRIDALVLDIASQIERKITIPMVLQAYWKAFIGFILLIIATLIFGIFLAIREKNRVEIVNNRYQVLSHMSNEYLFEYQLKSKDLFVSEKLRDKIDFKNHQKEITQCVNKIISNLHNNHLDQSISIIKLPIEHGEINTFRVLASPLRGSDGSIHSIMGKLTDITNQEKEREELIVQAQLDELTGLYNAGTAKKMILHSMQNKTKGQKDALIILDIDKFKEINDQYGHLQGNNVLQNVARGLKNIFQQTDILGRLGGDEFWVYMHNIPSEDFVRDKCRQLAVNIQEYNKEFEINTSIGIAVFNKKTTYEELFQQADGALYTAKRKGGAQIIVA